MTSSKIIGRSGHLRRKVTQRKGLAYVQEGGGGGGCFLKKCYILHHNMEDMLLKGHDMPVPPVDMEDMHLKGHDMLGPLNCRQRLSKQASFPSHEVLPTIRSYRLSSKAMLQRCDFGRL